MRSQIFLALALFTFSIVPMSAQFAERGPDGGTTFHVEGVTLLGIPGVPLTGKSRIEWTHTLEDGSSVTTYLEANLARDSQGHMYREGRSFVPAGSNETPRLNEMLYLDPVAKTRTVCTVATRQCVITDYKPHTAFAARPAGAYDNGKRYLERVNLGSDSIDGMNVAGTRETTTIYPGTIGNDHALVLTRDFWYSDEVKTNLKVIRKDPRQGTQTIQLMDLSTSEPDPSLFKLPAGYAVHDARSQARAAIIR